MSTDVGLALVFALIAFVYASAGFGGGSSYLAILALAALPWGEMRITALLCNLVVVGGNVHLFWQEGLLKARKIWPLLLGSLPAAYCAGRMRLSESTFFLLLGGCLVVAAVALFFPPQAAEEEATREPNRWLDAALGTAIGALSGLVGIGGGIFLAPVLHLRRWDRAHVIAATASTFILANSLAGLAGQLCALPPTLHWPRMVLLLLAVVAGGQAGVRWSLGRLNGLWVRRLTAVLVLWAGLEVLSRV